MPKNWISTGVYPIPQFSVKPTVSFASYWLLTSPSDFTYIAGIAHPINNYDGKDRLISEEIDLTEAPENLVLR